MVDKKTLTEEDIKRLFITKAVIKAGWADDKGRRQNKDGILLYRWQSDI